MSPTVFLHIGMPKCATTTVQQFLSENAAWLSRKGFRYEKLAEDETEDQGNAALLGTSVLHHKSENAKRMLDFFLRDQTNVILSSEALIGCARTSKFQWFFDDLNTRGFDIRVICYLRRQDLWIESDFKQHIKCQFPWTDDIYALIERRKKTRTIDFHWMVSNWARFAGVENVSVVPLNKSQDSDYPMRRFLEFIGIQNVPTHRLQTPAQNVSPPAGLIEAARHVKRSCMQQGFSAEKTERAVNKFLEDAATRITAPNRLHLMTTSERVQLVDHYADSNKRLSDEFLGGVPAFESVELLDDPDTTLDEDSDDVLARYAASHALAYQRSNPTRIMRSIKTRLRGIRTRF